MKSSKVQLKCKPSVHCAGAVLLIDGLSYEYALLLTAHMSKGSISFATKRKSNFHCHISYTKREGHVCTYVCVATQTQSTTEKSLGASE